MKFRQRRAIVFLLVLISLTAWALLSGSIDDQRTHATSEEESDLGLYRAIIERVRGGEGYYEVAVSEQVERGFATYPPMTVRLPMLSWVVAGLGEQGAHLALIVLVGAGIVAFLHATESMPLGRVEWIASTTLLAAGSALAFAPMSIYFHEIWAFGFILIGISAAARGKWWLAIIAALAAASFRELAAPFLLALMLLALLQANIRRALATAGASIVFVGAYLLHGKEIKNLAGTNSTPSPNWLDFGGWPFIVDLIHTTTPIMVVPYWLAAVLIAFALVGWFRLVIIGSQPHRVMFAAWLSFVIVFLFIGAPNNIYWGLLFAALVLPGIAASPRGIMLVARDLQGRRSSHTAQSPAND